MYQILHSSANKTQNRKQSAYVVFIGFLTVSGLKRYSALQGQCVVPPGELYRDTFELFSTTTRSLNKSLSSVSELEFSTSSL